ncbi:MAG: thymidine phosphorylase [Melioribacteraceae bacterium]|nr:thymidine phosphorylase [Melioribacteraceae bacterium]MCF8354808.1 thymidine phosphorylase [Melioribacteraceae bacterium]MCF8394561.1 thymidine phosphorylase [Melioribacteraceae bacterium]MCF8420220.1 thymidine phosphorylase [Melioribacteraceae bacterium]
MNTVQLIKKKREAEGLTEDEVNYLIKNYTKGKIPDYQFSAFLMAGYINGFTQKETDYLTNEMLFSGKVIDLSDVKGKKIDKHSTGGVGDKTSLVLAPIAAAAGINVPMISGRGLGHTGGTLDKLESIPGFRTDLSMRRFKSSLKKYNAAMIGQTKEIAPADKMIYALRDVTATVESIPLITASIMSKKLAEDADGFVFDIKTGSGAFMQKLSDSRKLAESLINTSKSFQTRAIGMITDMNQPLGKYIGNWLEVYESILFLQGEAADDLAEVTYNLSGAMIYLGGKAKSSNEGIEISRELIANGKAFNKFREIVKNQKGDLSFIDNPGKYPKSKFTEQVFAEKSGYLKSVNNYQIGMCSLELGAGRRTKEDKIDPKAGIIFHPKIGDRIKKGDLIAELFTDDGSSIGEVKKSLQSALKFSTKRVQKMKMIKQVIE